MEKSNFEGSASQAARIKSLKLPSHSKEISILHSPINDTEMHISWFLPGPGFMGDMTIGYQAGHGFINKHKAGGAHLVPAGKEAIFRRNWTCYAWSLNYFGGRSRFFTSFLVAATCTLFH